MNQDLRDEIYRSDDEPSKLKTPLHDRDRQWLRAIVGALPNSRYRGYDLRLDLRFGSWADVPRDAIGQLMEAVFYAREVEAIDRDQLRREAEEWVKKHPGWVQLEDEEPATCSTPSSPPTAT